MLSLLQLIGAVAAARRDPADLDRLVEEARLADGDHICSAPGGTLIVQGVAAQLSPLDTRACAPAGSEVT
ncbi:hypothetical protein [Blastochloris sulfoviridis]|uniref:Uncharacterized protein n=1 Tax=Blastochloris sulfoviridis TaxID=50712 RepID=A0A5M6HNB7_9HYPH|nr:hypothetical protein [Blastochloris sulfoviridis]KAA5597277.1 hypothetical protein F1193_14520 [Blastochloris sulfoviridis]